MKPGSGFESKLKEGVVNIDEVRGGSETKGACSWAAGGDPKFCEYGLAGVERTLVGVIVRSNSPSHPLSKQSCLLSVNRFLRLLPFELLTSLPGLLASILRSVGVAASPAD